MPVLRMARTQRGCGTRKKGGLYLFFDLHNVAVCLRLPMPIPDRCPVCGEELEQFRGIKIINPEKYFKPADDPCNLYCPVCTPPDHGAMMWVGKQFYSTASFTSEALTIGISKRIAKMPKDLKPSDVCYFAHPEAIPPVQRAITDETISTTEKAKPGIFLAARLSAFHKIIDEKQAADADLIKTLEDQGITPVVEYDDPAAPQQAAAQEQCGCSDQIENPLVPGAEADHASGDLNYRICR